MDILDKYIKERIKKDKQFKKELVKADKELDNQLNRSK